MRPAIGATTASQTVTLDNTGTAPISVVAARLTGADADQFSIDTDACTQTAVLAGQRCAVTVHARSTRDADASARLVFDRDGLSAAASVSLTSAPPPPPDDDQTPIPAPTPAPPSGAPKPAPTKPAAPKVTALSALTPSRGKHRVRVKLNAAGSVTISFTARIRIGKKLRTVVLGTVKSTFKAAGSRTVVVTLTKTGRTLLAKHRKLAVSAKVVTRVGAASATTTRKLTLR